MTQEELRKEATFTIEWESTPMIDRPLFVHAYITGAEPREKRIEELEEKISVLLSCKKCPENKGGFICQKEYEDKCLAQKIQYIKELQEENTELEKEVDLWKKASENNSYKAFRFEKETIQKVIESLLENGNLFFEDYEGKASPITYCEVKDDKIIFKE